MDVVWKYIVENDVEVNRLKIIIRSDVDDRKYKQRLIT